jgi:hypothetical protein
MAELLLHMTLIDFGRGGQTGAQRMTGEFGRPLVFAEVTMQAGGKGCGLDEAGDRVVIGAVRSNAFAASGDTAEERPLGELGEPGVRTRAVQNPALRPNGA